MDGRVYEQPIGNLSEGRLTTLQSADYLFTALKASVDRDRRPGRFLLTGSANVLFVPALADSLAGRMEIIRPSPFAQCEIEERAPAFLDALFGAHFKTRRTDRLSRRLAERIVAGGYPAAIARASPRRRAAWYPGVP